MKSYYYINGPKNFFPDGFDINIFKEKHLNIFKTDASYFSKEVVEWLKEIGAVNVKKGLIFRKHMIPRTNLHVDPNISGDEWVDLCPKFIDGTVDYKSYVEGFAINWTYQKAGTTEWYEEILGPDDIGTSSVKSGWFAWNSFERVKGPIDVCYHTDNPILFNTAVPHAPVNSVDKITVSLRFGLNINPSPTFNEAYEHLDRLGMIKLQQIE